MPSKENESPVDLGQLEKDVAEFHKTFDQPLKALAKVGGIDETVPKSFVDQLLKGANFHHNCRGPYLDGVNTTSFADDINQLIKAIDIPPKGELQKKFTVTFHAEYWDKPSPFAQNQTAELAQTPSRQKEGDVYADPESFIKYLQYVSGKLNSISSVIIGKYDRPADMPTDAAQIVAAAADLPKMIEAFEKDGYLENLTARIRSDVQARKHEEAQERTKQEQRKAEQNAKRLREKSEEFTKEALKRTREVGRE